MLIVVLSLQTKEASTQRAQQGGEDGGPQKLTPSFFESLRVIER